MPPRFLETSPATPTVFSPLNVIFPGDGFAVALFLRSRSRSVIAGFRDVDLLAIGGSFLDFLPRRWILVPALQSNVRLV